MSSYLLSSDVEELEELLEFQYPWEEVPSIDLNFLTNHHLAELLSILETANPYLKYDQHLLELKTCSDEDIDEPVLYQFSETQQQLFAQIAEAEDSRIREFSEYWQESESLQEHPVSLLENFLISLGKLASNSLEKKKSLYLYLDPEN